MSECLNLFIKKGYNLYYARAKDVPLLMQKSSLIQLQNENLTVLSYQIESISSKSQLPSLPC